MTQASIPTGILAVWGVGGGEEVCTESKVRVPVLALGKRGIRREFGDHSALTRPQEQTRDCPSDLHLRAANLFIRMV